MYWLLLQTRHRQGYGRLGTWLLQISNTHMKQEAALQAVGAQQANPSGRDTGQCRCQVEPLLFRSCKRKPSVTSCSLCAAVVALEQHHPLSPAGSQQVGRSHTQPAEHALRRDDLQQGARETSVYVMRCHQVTQGRLRASRASQASLASSYGDTRAPMAACSHGGKLPRCLPPLVPPPHPPGGP